MPVTEDLVPIVKFRYNYFSELCAPSIRRKLLSKVIPKRTNPSKENYLAHMTSLVREAKENPEKRILSIQFFASHGFNKNGY